MPIIDASAVANAPAAFRTKMPNRVLDEAWKTGWKIGVELASINSTCKAADEVGATARRVAAWARNVRGIEAIKDPNAMEDIVN